MIYCPNPNCQTPNSETNRFCQVCRTALPHRYLWAVGKNLDELMKGDLLADRYRLKYGRIFLDTKPGLPPELPAEMPTSVLPYLHLSVYPLQIPRPYSLLTFQRGKQTRTVLLLEEAAIRTDFNASDMTLDRTIILPKHQDSAEITTEIFASRMAVAVETLPTLDQAWESAASLRQLNWLWQMSKLWRHFQMEHVASSLITPELLRVDGSILRLLELSYDQGSSQSDLTLNHLGRFWSTLVKTAQPEVKPFLQELCKQLCRNKFKTAEQLTTCLDNALGACGQGQTLEFKLATYTDQGPTRQRNEDACFPPSGTVRSYTIGAGRAASQHPMPLLIVCDGIGGHESGDVASKLAIEVIQNALQPLSKESLIDPTTLMVGLEREICAANDAIAQRNDQERRSARERMGTTLVMAFLHGYELYLAHIGDSRAYRISPLSCRQATLDDDVATREVRLGYGFYRDAVLQPGAGSLVQALGMGASQSLYPTVQRFILDEDSIFLLCSDGLSDNEQVETFWPMEILPVLEGQQNFTAAGPRLIEVANTYNGHDNVTVGLIQVQITQTRPTTILPELAIPQSSPPPNREQPPTSAQSSRAPSAASSNSEPPPPARPKSAQAAPVKSTSIQSNTPQSSSSHPAPRQKPTATSERTAAEQKATARKALEQETPEQKASSHPPSIQPMADPFPSTQSTPLSPTSSQSPFGQQAPTESTPVDQPTKSDEKQASLWPLLLGIVFLLLIGGGMVFFLMFGFYTPVARSDREVIPPSRANSLPPSTPTLQPTSNVPTSNASEPQTLIVGSYIQISPTSPNTPAQTSTTDLTLQAQPGSADISASSSSSEPKLLNGVIPAGGVLQILNRQEVANQGRWVHLKVCSIPLGSALDVPSPDVDSPQEGLITENNSSSLPEQMLQPGVEGWILESQVRRMAKSTANLGSGEKGVCRQE